MFSVTRSPQTFQSSVSLNLMWTNFWKFCVRWHRHKSVDKPENRFSLFRLLPGSLTQLWYGLHMLDGILQRNLSHIYKKRFMMFVVCWRLKGQCYEIFDSFLLKRFHLGPMCTDKNVFVFAKAFDLKVRKSNWCWSHSCLETRSSPS